jgi:serine/threonine protein kinase/tetratricopeptide (TPR) repeat protein
VAVKCPKCHSENPSDSGFCSKCGTQLLPSEKIPSRTETLEAPREELTTGSTFAGRYQIIEELGKGGMGKVYRVLDKRLKEEVALKLIKPEIASDKETIERFSNELKLARRISHRNVGRMYELMEAEGTYFITMEYVPGQDLRRLIRQTGQLTTGKAISIARQVCEGLSEAHGLSVVHRDLKPGNILIDRDGNAKIMDFGIARSISAKGITGAGVMIGTPEYMSPEQVEGKEADQRSDIYSLGIILYEMVTGRVPFEGDTPLAIAVKHKTEAPRDPKLVNAQIPEDLSRVILRCLEKEKEKRYQTAGEVRSELENIEKGIPTTERIVPERKPLTSREITVTFGLKKLLLPAVILIAIVAIGVIVWKSLPQRQASIAVLPFRDLSPQKDQEPLCDGMTDEIIAKLWILKGWKVMNMASVLRYKNTEETIKDIGQELNVTTVLLGSVRKEENDIRVITQLVNAEDEFQLWSNTYEQKLERVFEIQSDIAEKIVKALEMKLSPEEKAQIQKKPTENMEAYNLYLQGRWFWNKRTLSGFQKAIEYFERAIEIDPNYALAYTGIADSYILIGGSSPFAGLSLPKAKEAALKALEIDSMLTEAHASLGMLKNRYDFDWKGSEKEFRRAIELNPNYATAHHWYSELLLYLGRFDEAIREIRRALELDPLSLAINRDVGFTLYFAREYDKAADALQRAIEMDPHFPWLHFYLGRVHLQKSMYEEAIKEIQKEKEVWGILYEPYFDAFIGIAYSRMGRKDEARKILERIEPLQVPFQVPYSVKAQLCFSLGENDRGFEYLDKESEQLVNSIPSLKIDPLVDSVRSDPRIKALLRKVNLE